MISGLIQKYFSRQERNSLKPVPRTYIKDKALADAIYDKGYAVAGCLDDTTLQKLTELYEELHHSLKPGSGMFISLFSDDISYRKKVHDSVGEILKPVYDLLFHDYRIVINFFLIKSSAPDSEFEMHQDSSGVDESKYSNLSLWIPLQDTDLTNGCICVVPYSHKIFFAPYRSISFEPLFQKIRTTVIKYMQPINLKKGEILLFDNRIVHNSVVNSSGRERVAIFSAVYPKDAPLINCFKDSASDDSPIELIKQDDDYCLRYQDFSENAKRRPNVGQTLGFVKWDTPQMTEKEFAVQCKKYKLEPS